MNTLNHLMRRVRAVLAITCLLGGLWLTASCQIAGAAKQLTETQALKVDKHLLRVALFNERATAVQRELKKSEDELKAERSSLEDEFRRTLVPATGAVFNWQTRTFEVPKSETKNANGPKQ